MAENKGYMTLSDEQGSIHISEEVIAAIAVGAVREVEGVSGMMGNLGTSVADLVTNKKGAQKNAKGVKIEMTENGLILDLSPWLTAMPFLKWRRMPRRQWLPPSAP